MGKSTISMAILNSKLLNSQRLTIATRIASKNLQPAPGLDLYEATWWLPAYRGGRGFALME